MLKIILFIVPCLITLNYAQKCVPRNFGDDSIVCVCNATYCDYTAVNIPAEGKFRVYTSSRNGERFNEEILDFDSESKNRIKLELDPNQNYQSIHGFGGAFTDSAGLNIKSLSEETQQHLLKSYFTPNGSNYNLCRVPVGGSDFSTRAYSLDDENDDISLSKFSLTKEDDDYKMPYMKKALEINSELRFVAASWTAPKWMKTNNAYSGFLGFLKKECYQTYANYLVKFLESYKSQGLPIWAISTGNEPTDVFVPTMHLNDMGWLPSTVTTWVVNNFGPAIANSSSSETLILALDDQRFNLPWYIHAMYNKNPNIDKYLAGIAVHWYADSFFPVMLNDQTHEAFPNKFLLMTEASTGFAVWETPKVRLGSWSRGERYILSIIEDLNHWITGWIDWNLALNKQGGPNWINNFVDSPIIVDSKADEFFKQPMYYAISHFSKFIPRESVKVELSQSEHIKSIAFKRPDDAIVIVLYNKDTTPKHVTIKDPKQGNINVECGGKSIKTIIYQ